MRRICVYCGSNSGGHDDYREAARALAGELVRHDLELVYGGASKGTMGILADAVLELDGKVHGVIPKALEEKEIAHQGLTELHIVDSMHDRKTKMAMLSDGFIALPGGFGTLEELIEILTWGSFVFTTSPVVLSTYVVTSTSCSPFSITPRPRDSCGRRIGKCCYARQMPPD